MSDGHGGIFGVLEALSGPEIRHALTDVPGGIGKDYALNQISVGFVARNFFVDPVIPLASLAITFFSGYFQKTVNRSRIAPGEVAQLVGPPRGVSGPLQKLLYLSSAFILGVIREESLHFIGRRQRAG